MNKAQRKAARFLRQYQMDPLDVNLDETVETFLAQMRRGLAGKPSTLEMIPTYLTADNDVPSHQKVIVADAGGTHFRVATVYFDDAKNAVIENLELFRMPGIERELDCEAFFAAMAGYFRTVAAAAERVGFCFSYPVEILPDKDGRMLHFSKEIKVRGVKGRLVGKGLNRALAAAGLAGDKQFVLLNDTVATLLAGVGHQNRVFDGFIGFILGTGTNCCYIEHNADIKKTPGLDRGGSQIINTESGGMCKGYHGVLDARFDKTTVNPGTSLFEKMISGAYLGPLSLFVLEQAAKDGLFSGPAASAIRQIGALETKDLNLFLQYPAGDNPLAAACRQGGGDDTQIAFVIADRLTERAAKLSACNLSAMALKSGRGADPTRPVGIVAEGTTFYKMRLMRSRVEYYLKSYLELRRKIYTEIIHVDNATLIGAAIAGLTN